MGKNPDIYPNPVYKAGADPNATTTAAVVADNAIVRGDGGARGLQDSGVLIDDSDNVTGATTIALGSGAVGGPAVFFTSATTSGMYWDPNSLRFATLGVLRLSIGSVSVTASDLQAANAAGPSFINEATSVTNPVFCPDRAIETKGMGGSDGGDDVSIISNSIESLSVSDGTGVRVGKSGGKVGFYATAPVVLQTGVAVSAGGVHAALVNLGLITA